MLEGDVTYGGDVEEPCEGVGALGGEDVEQRHAAVEACQGTLTPQQLPATTHIILTTNATATGHRDIRQNFTLKQREIS